MTAPKRSDIPLASAERLAFSEGDDAERIRLMARTLRRDKGLVLLDPAKVSDPWRREVVEQVADEQIGAVGGPNRKCGER